MPGFALCGLLALAGCKIIDQRTFEPPAKAPGAAALAQQALPKRPLLVISFRFPDADWKPAVRQAVLDAEARKPNVAFDVATPIPTSAPLDVQDQYSKAGLADGQAVARELQNDGVPPDRISVRFQGDPGAPDREVRVYVQ